MIGSSDSHTALAAVEEHNFWGKQPVDEPGPTRVDRIWGSPDSGMPNTLQLASGYAAVWEAVVADFVARAQPGGLRISINDGGARPDTVSLRLLQGARLMEA